MECNHLFKRILNEHSHSLLNECHTIQSKLKYIFTNALLDCRDDILKSRIYYSMATLFTFQSNQSLKNGRQKQQRLALQSINQAIEILENSSSLSNSSKLLLNKCYEFFNQLCCRQQPNTIEKLMENKNWKLNHFGFLFEFDENCSIFYNKQKGRYLKTLTKNKMNSIPYGTHIIRERAISIILDSNQYHHYCSNCYRRLSLSTMIFFPCHYCHQIVFCSRKCEQKANTHGGLWTAMINHSCDPNAYWDIDQGGYITITTASKIEPDTEINISYGIYANDYNFNERQQYLWKRYRFHCQCNACLKQQQQEQEQQTLTEFIQNDKNSID
ncbi:hypothetical protein DERP_007025 [Dermatophagoides pteronyssinus]|uniref:SET domain-containing protein n=1 Tax=Dermatophagoides pteronyssinus TaxID=6956 RepID=A0ABQ8JUH7_DERPT|nr:hypothetical protein DERP_007025 [Dermatophagoides pteronyssinus]